MLKNWIPAEIPEKEEMKDFLRLLRCQRHLDWRNREKWDAYEGAVGEMLTKTSTTYAPWYILESMDKKYARIKALKIVIEQIEKALD